MQAICPGRLFLVLRELHVPVEAVFLHAGKTSNSLSRFYAVIEPSTVSDAILLGANAAEISECFMSSQYNYEL